MKKKLGVSNTPYDGGRWVTDGSWWLTDGSWWVTDGSWRVTAEGNMRTYQNTQKKKPNTVPGVICGHKKDKKKRSQKEHVLRELNLGPLVLKCSTTTT